MEFDWLDVSFDLSKVTPKEIEESFEDPFAVRLLPDGNYGSEDARYICLGPLCGKPPAIQCILDRRQAIQGHYIASNDKGRRKFL